MATIKQKSNDDWRGQRSREQLANGGLPLNAEWRLRRLAEGRPPFSSFFSVNELALTGSVGVRPLGQVMGVSSFHAGLQPESYVGSKELTSLSMVQERVRRLALLRMQQEAATLSARAVLGVRLETRANIDGNALLEVRATGTAVDWHETRPPSSPILCGLSGQEFHALRQGGYRPVGLALGACVYYQIGSANTTQAAGSALMSGTAQMNQELRDYTHGFSRARTVAVGRLEVDAVNARAEGVVGLCMEKTMETQEVEMEISERKVHRRDLVVTISLLGTAIAPFTDHAPSVHSIVPLGT